LGKGDGGSSRKLDGGNIEELLGIDSERVDGGVVSDSVGKECLLIPIN